MMDLPDDWDPPEDMLKPTRYPGSNLAIKMLSCESLGHDVLALLGRFITEQALYNLWFVSDVKGSDRGVQEVLALTNFGEEQVRNVYEAWTEYERSLGLRHLEPSVQREQVMAANASLVRALEQANAELVNIRARGKRA